jgi:putative nucleotidyltransferase with HDIG domain
MCASLTEQKSIGEPWALEDLPPFPWITTKVLQLCSGDGNDLDFSELTDLIRSDTSFAAELLCRANSPLFGMQSQVDSVDRAVTMIGLYRVRSLALTLGVTSYIRSALRISVLRRCWRHSVGSALLAEELAEPCGLHPDLAYTAGLLHDIGRLALLVKHPQPYADLLTVVSENQLSLLQGERDLFEIDHCEAGAWLTETWELPTSLIDVIANHHHGMTSKCPPIWRLIHLTCRLADSLGFAVVETAEQEQPEAILTEFPRPVQLNPDDIEKLRQRIVSKVNALE